MSIKADVTELQELNVEIKRIQKHVRDLRQRKENCESRILDYLDVHDQPGLKFKGVTIVAQNKQKRKYEKKSEKLSRGEQVLQRHGIYNSKEALDELINAMRAEPEEVNELRIL